MLKQNLITHNKHFISKLFYNIYPWIIFVMGACFFFYKYFVQVSPSVMTVDLMRDFNLNGAGLGNLSASYFYAYLVMQIPVGILLDKYSPRYLTSFAILLCGVSTLFFSQTTTPTLAILSRFFIGLGAAFSALSCFKLSSQWFPSNRFALISGLCMTSAMLGAIFGQYPLSLLVQNFDWRTALKIIGVCGVILSIFYFIIVRDKENNQVTITRKTRTEPVSLNFLSILKNKQAWLISLYSGLAFAPVSVFGGLWGVPFLKESHQLSASQASFATSCIFIGFAIGAPFLGWMSDLIQRRKPIMLLGTLIALVSLSITLYFTHLPISTISILLFMFGFGASGFFTCFAMIREVFPLVLVASVLGFMNTFDTACEALTEPLLGGILDFTWDGTIKDGVHHFSLHGYQLALSLLPLYMISALIVLIFIKETYCRLQDPA